MANNSLYLYSGAPSPFLGKGFSVLSRELSSDPGRYLNYYERGKLVRRLSYSEYFSLVAGLNEKIRTFTKPGSKVVVSLGNTLEAFVAYGSILSLGGTVVPVDPKEGDSYLQEIVRCTGSEVMLGEKREHIINKSFNFQIKDLTPGVFKDFTDHDPASLFFTSGTTGGSKGVTQNFSSLLANLEATKKAGLLDEKDNLFSCLPVFHVNAFNFAFLLPLYLRCQITFSSEYPLTFWKILNDEKISVASLAPPIIRLLNADSRTHTAPDSLRYFITASSAIYREDIEQMLSRFGVRIVQAYGLSETVNFTLFNPPDISRDDYRKIHFEAAVPSAGVATWGNDVQLMDSEGELIGKEDQEGEIVVRGWCLQTGYFGNEEATAEAFHEDFFHTGDIAFFRKHNGQSFFYITGRKKEVVKRKGKLIYLSEVDGVIKSIGLHDACAVGFSNSHTEEEVGIFVVKGSTDLTHEQILSKLQPLLHPAKRPKVVIEGETLPRTSVGKVKRNLLKPAFISFKDTKFNE